MFWVAEAGLSGTRFRNYDPELGRWLSRDPLGKAEIQEGPNLYAYVRNNPVSSTDPLGLCCEQEAYAITLANWRLHELAKQLIATYNACVENIGKGHTVSSCNALVEMIDDEVDLATKRVNAAVQRFMECVQKGCYEPPPCEPGCARNPITGEKTCHFLAH